jgi:outer membrane protein assembly factor BamD (BamD/ComL family)
MKIFKCFGLVMVFLLFLDCAKKEYLNPQEFDISTPEGLFLEGQYYLKSKNFDYALRSFYSLIEDFPDDTLTDDAQFLIAQILAHPQNPNRDLEEAVFEYENLIDNYPQSPYFKKAQKELRRLQKLLKSEKE